MTDFFLRYRTISIFLFFTILSIVLITFQLRVLDRVVLFIFAPIEKSLIYSVEAMQNHLVRFFTLINLSDDHRFLLEENLKLKNHLIEWEELKSRINRLEDLLQLEQEVPYKTVAARVIGKSPISPSSILIIDKGFNHGINKYQGVINPQGVVGRIIGYSDNSAKVQMIIDADCSIAAINQRTRDNGLVQGLGFDAFSLNMAFVYFRSEIRIGDRIVTSGMDNVFPKGLLIGQVIRVEKEKNKIFYKGIHVQPAVDFNRVEEVLIIIFSDLEAKP